MAFKTENINSRFKLQGVFTILLIGTLILAIFLSSAQKKKTLQVVSITTSVSDLITQLDNNLEKALKSQPSDPNFVNLNCDQFINYNWQQVNHVIDSVKLLRNIYYLKRHVNKKSEADSLNSALNSYGHFFEIALLSFKEKGNKYEGRIALVYSLNQKLIKRLVTSQNEEIPTSELIAVSADYFASLDYTRLLAYRDICNTISETLYTDLSMDNQAVDYLDQIKRELDNIELIDNRLSEEGKGEGQLVDLSLSYQHVVSSFDEFKGITDYWDGHFFKLWDILFLILAVLLTTINIIIGSKFSGKIKSNLKSLVKASSSLKEGDFNSTINDEGHFEFGGTFTNLNSLKESMVERTLFVDKLLTDDFSQNIEKLGKNDTFSKKLIDLKEKLFTAQKEQEKRNEENEVRRYINEGLAKFADIMRVNSNNTVALGDNLIRELVNYLGAMIGGMFLTDETDPSILNLISAFAYDRKKFLSKTIKMGEGLIGTCAIEKKTINLKQVPKDYIIIKSGLGDAPPNSILLVPVLHEKDLVGVIEIASLKKLNSHEVELTEQIASSLASTIITARNNTKTALLLEKSQQQAAEMAEQEEEMRQNMEELKATQEESARREEEMQGILDAIGTSFYVLEYDTDGNITHLNERLLKFLNEPYESLIGKKHQDIFSTSSKLNTKLFSEITLKKEPQNITEELNWGSKKLSYKHYLSPVLSKYGEVIKVLNILTIEEVKTSKNKR